MVRSGGRRSREGRLAAAFQEPLTATARLCGGRSAPPDATTFRAHIKRSLAAAADEARTQGYPDEFVEQSVYAVVALLDEVVFDLPGDLRVSWSGSPLQEEIFGHHTAGEQFFVNVQDLLQRQDSPLVADVLEVYLLSLFLGFKGRYSTSSGTELGGFSAAIGQKIQRIRGLRPELSVHALPPRNDGVDTTDRDEVGRTMTVLVVAGVVGLILLTIALRLFSLSPALAAIQDLGA